MQDTPRDDTNGAGGPDPAAGTPTPPPEPGATPAPPPEPTAAPAPPPEPAASPVPPAAPAATPAPAPQPAPAPAPVGSGGTKPLIARVRDILMQPKSEWEVIAREPATVGSVFVPYALILAAIGPLAGLLGGQLFGYSFGPISWRPPLGGSLAYALISYALSLGSVFVLALIIDALAPTFGGTKNQVNATKVAVYSWTAAWLAGIFAIVPPLAVLSIVGLYSLYLLYLGLTPLMRAPQDKAAGYAAVTIVVAIVLYMVVGWLAWRLLAGMMMPTLPTIY